MRDASPRVTRHRNLSFVVFFFALTCVPALAQKFDSKIMCRPELGAARRNELAEKLRAITGWSALRFDEDGALRFGDAQPVGGSQTARALLAAASAGKTLILIEDASGSRDVVFCRVIEGRWREGASAKPPVFVVQIDFADFAQVSGDAAARAAFNAGWGFMHEVEHVVGDTADASALGGAGDCEELINRMRRECGLAERAEYFYTLVPGAERGDFKTRYVRLAFERRAGDAKPKRYWLLWDADRVGGFVDARQVAALR